MSYLKEGKVSSGQCGLRDRSGRTVFDTPQAALPKQVVSESSAIPKSELLWSLVEIVQSSQTSWIVWHLLSGIELSRSASGQLRWLLNDSKTVRNKSKLSSELRLVSRRRLTNPKFNWIVANHSLRGQRAKCWFNWTTQRGWRLDETRATAHLQETLKL